MESGSSNRGYRTHQFASGERRSRSPGYRRVNHLVSPTRRSHHYINQENESYAAVKSKLNNESGTTPENRNEMHHANLLVSSKEDSRRASVPQDAHSTADADLTELMTFRTFMITSVDESCDPQSSVKAYEAYKEDFEKRYVSAVHWALRDLFIIAERYNPTLRLRQHEETTLRCRQEASLFVKLMMEERFFGISLIDKFSSPSSCLEIRFPFQLNIGPALRNNELAHSSLRAPFWFPPDPNFACLCLRNVPMTLSKWDLVNHLITIDAAEGLVDVTLTPCENFILSYPLRKRPASNLFRDVWIKFSSDECCAACDAKLDGTRCKDVVCRPIRRVPNPSSYILRVAPSETCHPARILRDLHISARLILKLDKDFGVTDVLGQNMNDMEKESTEVNMESNENQFQLACLGHPVLAEFNHVMLNQSGRSPEEQLDLQLLYLRLVHNVCYYSGRKFRSARELWNEVGTLYVRPSLQDSLDINLLLPGFGAEHDAWDKHFIEAEDVWNVNVKTMLGASECFRGDDQRAPQIQFSPTHRNKSLPPLNSNRELFLETFVPNVYFEPCRTVEINGTPKVEDYQEELPHEPSMCNELLQETYVKVEDNADVMNSTLNTESTNLSKTCTSRKAVDPSNIKNFARGRSSPWLQVLDARLRWLFSEKHIPSILDENSPEFLAEWDTFCESTVEKYYDAEHDMEKWACPSCSKQFRGLHYVKNHLKHKHRQCFDDCLSRATDNSIRNAIYSDPYKLPVLMPSPTPYLYRMKNFRLHHRQDMFYLGNNSIPLRQANQPVTLESSFKTFMNHGVGPRLGVEATQRTERTYRDWDAPASNELHMAQGNLRTCVLYDDL